MAILAAGTITKTEMSGALFLLEFFYWGVCCMWGNSPNCLESCDFVDFSHVHWLFPQFAICGSTDVLCV